MFGGHQSDLLRLLTLDKFRDVLTQDKKFKISRGPFFCINPSDSSIFVTQIVFRTLKAKSPFLHIDRFNETK